MERDQKGIMRQYKNIICKTFGGQIRVKRESGAIGPMGQFQIQFLYEPTKVYVTLDADRGVFTLDLADDAQSGNTLNWIKKFDNSMTEESLETATFLLK